MLQKSNHAEKEQHGVYPYKSMLNKIAYYFGFQSDEINELINQVYASTHNYRTGSAISSYKLSITKALVRQCVRKISLQLFGNAGRTASSYTGASFQRYLNSTHLALQNLPLHYRTVIILEWSSLTPGEIGEILNITPTEVYKLAWKAKEYLSQPRL